MSFQDQTLVCQQCGGEFIFSASQQERFAQRGFQHPPKLCKPCYDAKKQTEGGSRQPQRGRGPRPADRGGEYRGPAFRDSAPEHRGGGGPGPRRQGPAAPSEYRSPAFRGPGGRDDSRGAPRDDRRGGDGRGPRGAGGAPSEYRAPAFQQRPRGQDDEYRSPAFRDRDLRDSQSEYRAPGFQDQRTRHRDEQPLFQLTCSRCGQKSMVPFIPEEKEDPMCEACYREQRRPKPAAVAAPTPQPLSLEGSGERSEQLGTTVPHPAAVPVAVAEAAAPGEPGADKS